MRLRLVVIIVVGLALILLTGCGSGTVTPPTVNALLSQTIAATSQQHAAHFSAALNVSHNGTNSFSLDASGGFSPGVVNTTITATTSGHTYTAKIQGANHDLYVYFNGTWYGQHNCLQLCEGSQENQPSSKSNSPVNPSINMNQVLKDIQQYRSRVVNATVHAGNEQGTSVWVVPMTLNAPGIISLIQQFDSQDNLSKQDQQEIISLASHVHITVEIGEDDHLLRSIQITANNINLAGIADTPQVKSLGTLNISLNVQLSQWGKTVVVSPPTHYKTFMQLEEGLFSLFEQLGSGSNTGALSPTNALVT